MLGTHCFCWFHRLGYINACRPLYHISNEVRGFNLTISFSQHGRLLCSKAKVPPDVLKSKADEFSGKKSELFESTEIQNILKRMTSIDLDKVFKARKEDLSNPVYKVLDDKEIKRDEEEILKKAEELLVMPPVRDLRKPIDVIRSHDPELIQHDEDGADYVFTDISPSKDLRTRAVLIRENSTGILREANWDERDRMQFLYWPKEGQTYEVAPMLQDENLPFVFDQMRHEDVLDFINIQCEPDSPDYIRVTRRVYEDILNRNLFDILNSTRYYGGMIFYYIINKKTNKIFTYFLKNGRLDEASDIVKLHSLVNAIQYNDEYSNEELVRTYINQNGLENLLNFIDGFQDAVSQ